MYKADGNHVTLTRGDTFDCQIIIYDADNNRFFPSSGDTVRFAMKRTYYDRKPVLVKDIPIDTLILHFDSEDTKKLLFGDYVYDVEITFGNGVIDTFISGVFTIGLEVE